MLHEINCLSDVLLKICCCLSTDSTDRPWAISLHVSWFQFVTCSYAHADHSFCTYLLMPLVNEMLQTYQRIQRFSTIFLPSALHPKPRCFYWNPPPLSIQSTAVCQQFFILSFAFINFKALNFIHSFLNFTNEYFIHTAISLNLHVVTGTKTLQTLLFDTVVSQLNKSCCASPHIFYLSNSEENDRKQRSAGRLYFFYPASS